MGASLTTCLNHFRQLYSLETARRRLHSQSPLAMTESDLQDKTAALEEAQTRHRRRQISDAELARITSQHVISSARLCLAKDAMEQAEADWA